MRYDNDLELLFFLLGWFLSVNLHLQAAHLQILISVPYTNRPALFRQAWSYLDYAIATDLLAADFRPGKPT